MISTTPNDNKQIALEQLVSLINATTGFEATWVRFHLLLQAGLAAALWAVGPSAQMVAGATNGQLRGLLSLLIPLFGMIFCVAVTIIHVGIQRWTRWYMHKVRALNLGETIFPAPGPGEQELNPNGPHEFPVSQRAWVILVVNVLIILAWATAGGVLLASSDRSWPLPIAIPALSSLVALGVLYWRVAQRRHVFRLSARGRHVFRLGLSVGRGVRLRCSLRPRKAHGANHATLAVLIR